MNLKSLKISLGLAIAALVASLAFASTATARIPVEPGPGSPVTYQPRQPAAKKAKKVVKRNWGGYPLNGHTHVKSLFAPDEP